MKTRLLWSSKFCNCSVEHSFLSSIVKNVLKIQEKRQLQSKLKWHDFVAGVHTKWQIAGDYTVQDRRRNKTEWYTSYSRSVVTIRRGHLTK